MEKLQEKENEEKSPKYFELINKKFWKFQKSSSLLIRKSFYSCCISICKINSLLEKISPKMSPILLGSFNVQEKELQTSILDSLVNLMKSETKFFFFTFLFI